MFTLSKLKISAVITFIILSVNVYGGSSHKFCDKATRSGASAIEINLAAFKTIDNMLPIRIGSIELGKTRATTSLDSDKNMFLCSCKAPPPIFTRLGLSISFWNPIGTIDTTSLPYCFPSLGTSLDMGLGASASYGARSDGSKDQYITSQTHYFSSLNIMQVLSDTIFAACFTVDIGTGLDHISEILPWWQNDIWSTIFSPEGLLVANPVAVAACMADSLAVATSKTALNALFWCYGAWGASYPTTINVGSGTPLTGYAMLAGRTISSQFKALKIMKTNGKHMLTGQCQPSISAFTLKNEVNMFPIYPFSNGKRFPIGYPSEMWGIGIDNPANLGVMTWMLYQKRDCCYL